MPHPNAERIRDGFDAFAAGDFGALAGLIHERVAWRIRGTSALAGAYDGRDAVFGLFRRTAELSGGTYRVEPRWVLADDERAVVAYRARGSREGRELDIEQALLIGLEDGLIADVDAVPLDQAAFDAFWA